MIKIGKTAKINIMMYRTKQYVIEPIKISVSVDSPVEDSEYNISKVKEVVDNICNKYNGKMIFNEEDRRTALKFPMTSVEYLGAEPGIVSLADEIADRVKSEFKDSVCTVRLESDDNIWVEVMK